MVRIIVTQNLGLKFKDIEKLKQIGDLKIYNELSKTLDECLKR
ncbi:MAG: hypothetical protein U9O66_00495 [Patescibacteria group bacterium]|nr:hypothetical protein [Patescibacteria group bacterium]